MQIKKLQNHSELVINVLKRKTEQPQDIGVVQLVDMPNNLGCHPQILGNGNRKNRKVLTGLP
jgi:hypothetical protein